MKCQCGRPVHIKKSGMCSRCYRKQWLKGTERGQNYLSRLRQKHRTEFSLFDFDPLDTFCIAFNIKPTVLARYILDLRIENEVRR